MSKHIPKLKFLILFLVGLAGSIVFFTFAKAQTDDEAKAIKPIIMTEPKDSLEDRMERKITLDVRDMNIVDVIKFLAQKGEFNVIIAPSVEGRTTVLLHDVLIKDALDIVVISNKLAYHMDDDIVQVMSAGEYEAMYGKQFSDKTQVSIVRLQYAKPSYVLAALDNMRSNRGKIIIDEDTGSVVLVDTPQSIALMKKAILQIEQPLETMVFNLKYAKADIVAEKLRSRIDAKAVGTITADERSNQILVRVFPGRRDEVEKTVRSLDLPTKEVLIEARVLQIVINPTNDVGMDITAPITSNGHNQLSLSSLPLKEAALSAADNLSNNFGRIAVGNFNGNDFTAAIRALQQVSDTKILSTPQILVTNNEEAKIHIGDTVPYIVATTNGTGTNAITSDDVRFVDVGLKLSVIPTINDDGMVTMKLTPEISEVVAKITSAEGSTIPQVNKTEVETSVMVKDGQTIVMAGLRNQNKSHTKKGIPGLMDIPWIGGAFSRTADTLTNSEIIILITPHIVKGTDDFEKTVGAIKGSKTYNESIKLNEPATPAGAESK
ncbi:MAG: type II secretion system protein GspD [Candidatus Omnitrophica bacterium]|nr:type II secretion system protein GspD [Candidatus Omnitrophota bacterium]